MTKKTETVTEAPVAETTYDELFSADEVAAVREFRRLPAKGAFVLDEAPTKHIRVEGASGKQPQYVASGHVGTCKFKFAVPALIAEKLLTLPAEKYVGKSLVYRNGTIGITR